MLHRCPASFSNECTKKVVEPSPQRESSQDDLVLIYSRTSKGFTTPAGKSFDVETVSSPSMLTDRYFED